MEPKVPEDIYKSHLEPTSKCFLSSLIIKVGLKTLAQWVARLARNVEVVGSSPIKLSDSSSFVIL